MGKPKDKPEDIYGPMGHLVAAYRSFREEAKTHPKDGDENSKAYLRAALEDAAEVAKAIRRIENGTNRGQHPQEYLDRIMADEENDAPAE